MTDQQSQLTWELREPPLACAAVVAIGDSALRLAAATSSRLRLGDAFSAAGGEGWLLVIGEDLPWADGVTYLGREEGILVPTSRRTSFPAALVKASLGPQVPPGCDLLVLLPGRIFVCATPHGTADPDRLLSAGSLR